MSEVQRLAAAQASSWAVLADVTRATADDPQVSGAGADSLWIHEQAGYCDAMAEGWQTAADWLTDH